MRRIAISLITVCACLTCVSAMAMEQPAGGEGRSPEQEKKVSPQENLETAIPYALRLIKKDEIEKLLLEFLEPDMLKKLKESPGLDKVVEQFRERNAQDLVEALEQVRDIEPTFDEDGKLATFKLKKKVGSHEEIQFRKHGKNWHICN